jgi:hypothetical protein
MRVTITKKFSILHDAMSPEAKAESEKLYNQALAEIKLGGYEHSIEDIAETLIPAAEQTRNTQQVLA